MSYSHFHTLDQVVSWGRYLVENEVLTAKDFTFQKMLSLAKLRENKRNRGSAYAHAAKLAADYPEEYYQWCTLQKLTGKRIETGPKGVKV